MGCVTLFGALCLLAPTVVQAQERKAPSNAPEQGGFPDASFDATFRKYTAPENAFSPFYSWDADLALRATVFRKGPGAVCFGGAFQTVGTESFGETVSVGGTGYLLRLGYVHTYSADFSLSAGLAHLSSHLTRDLDAKIAEEQGKGTTIPTVLDPDQYNVLFFKAHWRVPAWPFTPDFEFILQPVSFRFNGSQLGYVRPVFIGTRWTLWQGHEKSVVVETQHEIGDNPFNRFSLRLELYARNQPEGRFQVFVDASPGHQLHVSPNVGAVRDGIALGLQMHFRE